jgi:urea transport system substrate-binding protein
MNKVDAVFRVGKAVPGIQLTQEEKRCMDKKEFESFYDQVKQSANRACKEDKKAIVNVGLLFSCTGTMKVIETNMACSVLLAIQEINQQELLPNTVLVPTHLDCESDPKVFYSKTFEYLKETTPTPDVLIGCYTSSSRRAVIEAMNDVKDPVMLIYPNQYEGMEDEPNVISTGPLPNQQVIPALDYFISGTTQNMKILLVGSDYLYPRATETIIKDWLKQKMTPVYDSVFVPYEASDNFGDKGKSFQLSQDILQVAVDKIKSNDYDIILNLLNGDINADFLKQLFEQGFARDTPIIAPSISETEVVHFKSKYLKNINLNLVWGFSSSQTCSETSFATQFKRKFGKDSYPSSPMFNAYMGLFAWAKYCQEVRSSGMQNGELSIVEQHDELEVKQGDDLVVLDPKSRHAYKSPMIIKVAVTDEQIDFETVSLLDPDKPLLAPMLFPDYGAKDKWIKYAKSLHWVTSVAQPYGMQSFYDLREQIIGTLPFPKEGNSFISLVEKNNFDDDINNVLRMPLYRDQDAHEIHELYNIFCLSDEYYQSEYAKMIKAFNDRIDCIDKDMEVRLTPSQSAEFKSFVTAKVKAFCYRKERVYLFDWLHYAITLFAQKVEFYWEDSVIPLESKVFDSIACLIHETLQWGVDTGKGVDLWRVLRSDRPKRAEGHTIHRVEFSPGMSPSTFRVCYTLHHQRCSPNKPLNLDALCNKPNGNASSFFRMMQHFFGIVEDSEQPYPTMCLEYRKPPSFSQSSTKGNGLRVFSWETEGEKEDINHLAMVGTRSWNVTFPEYHTIHLHKTILESV